MALSVDLRSGSQVLSAMQSRAASRQQVRESQARLPGVKAQSDMLVQDALEYVTDWRKKERKTKSKAETVEAERAVELAPVITEKERATAVADTAKAEEDVISLVEDSVATATPENWSKVAESASKQLGIELTGDWEQDKAVRENIISSATNTIEQRQALAKQQIQLQVAQLYANKLPQDIQTVQTAFPGDPEAQQQMLRKLLNGRVSKLLSSGASSTPQFNPSSPTKAEQGLAQNYFEELKDTVEPIGKLSGDDFKALRGASAFRAKAIMEEMGNAGQPIDYPTALNMAVEELAPSIKPNPKASPFMPWQPSYLFDRQQATMGTLRATTEQVGYNPAKPISATNSPFKTPNDVKQAVKSGDISKAQGLAILKYNFSPKKTQE